ncbi:hypothetical protein VF21_04848 [Pseudogymnoascus sp. 05NY08]|nr:hypothetical protein VF21_04848 [Pseudogymnoascus sp. 05NY08]
MGHAPPRFGRDRIIGYGEALEIGVKAAEDKVQVAQAETPDFEKVHWRSEPHLRKLYALGFVLMIASATTGYDGMLINTSQQIKLWELYFPEVSDKNKLGILVNMFNIESIISFFFTPYIADRWGRKFAITCGCLIMCLGGCLSAFCNGYGMFIAGRFVLGFGNSLAQMCSPLLLTEICHPQHRGPVTAIYDWIPESPRFLISKDRTDEALEMLATYHAGGDKNNATVQYEFQEIKETMRLDKLTNRAVKYTDFFRTKGNRWRLAIIISLGVISQYSGNAILSNYINVIYEGAGIHDQNQKLGITTGKTILDLSVTIAAALSVDRFGRRPLFLTSICGMVACFVCWIITSAVYENSNLQNSGAGYAQLVFNWLFGCFYDIGFSGLLVAYALEVLPFHLRAKGMMIMNITVQAILALSNKTNLLAWDNLPNHWNFMLFYTLWDSCELVFVYFFYVETNGPTLEQICKIFDGDDAAAHIDLHQVEKEIAQQHHEDDIVEVQAASLKGAA